MEVSIQSALCTSPRGTTSSSPFSHCHHHSFFYVILTPVTSFLILAALPPASPQSTHLPHTLYHRACGIVGPEGTSNSIQSNAVQGGRFDTSNVTWNFYLLPSASLAPSFALLLPVYTFLTNNHHFFPPSLFLSLYGEASGACTRVPASPASAFHSLHLPFSYP